MIRRAALCLLSVLVAPAAAQTSARPSPGLFDATQPLELTLTTDLKAVVKDRDPTKQHKYHRAVLGYVDSSGAPASLDLRVRTRGHFRLKTTTCSFPPLQLDLPKKAAVHTPFGARDKLKLTTYCRDRDEYEQYVVQEYLIYRVYNLFTEQSFRARLTRVTYADSAAREKPVTRYGFVIEEDKELAARLHAALVGQQGLTQQDFDPENMTLVSVLEYFVGNTDWSVWGLHNIVVLRDSNSVLYAVPYDFDWSGVIGTVYARPDARLPIQSVRQRLFRGACRTPEQFAAVFARFQEKKDAIYALYRDEPALAPKTREQALRYYDEFYKTIENPGAIKREFLQKCGNQT